MLYKTCSTPSSVDRMLLFTSSYTYTSHRMADAHKSSVEEVDIVREKEAVGSVHGVDANPAAAALAAVTEANKPRMFSKGMIKLWMIVRALLL